MYGQPMQMTNQQGAYPQGGYPQVALTQQQVEMMNQTGYQMGQPGQMMMGQQGQMMMVPVMPIVRTDANNEPQPIQVQCPKCQQTNMTQITHYRGKGTCCCMILMIFWAPCVFFLPLCCKDCQDKRHNCPNCGNVVGLCAPIRTEDRRYRRYR